MARRPQASAPAVAFEQEVQELTDQLRTGGSPRDVHSRLAGAIVTLFDMGNPPVLRAAVLRVLPLVTPRQFKFSRETILDHAAWLLDEERLDFSDWAPAEGRIPSDVQLVRDLVAACQQNRSVLIRKSATALLPEALASLFVQASDVDALRSAEPLLEDVLGLDFRADAQLEQACHRIMEVLEGASVAEGELGALAKFYALRLALALPCPAPYLPRAKAYLRTAVHLPPERQLEFVTECLELLRHAFPTDAVHPQGLGDAKFFESVPDIFAGLDEAVFGKAAVALIDLVDTSATGRLPQSVCQRLGKASTVEVDGRSPFSRLPDEDKAALFLRMLDASCSGRLQAADAGVWGPRMLTHLSARREEGQAFLAQAVGSRPPPGGFMKAGHHWFEAPTPPPGALSPSTRPEAAGPVPAGRGTDPSGSGAA